MLLRRICTLLYGTIFITFVMVSADVVYTSRAECQIDAGEREAISADDKVQCHRFKGCWDITATIKCYRAKATLYPRNCQESYFRGNSRSGLQQLQTFHGEVFTVYCHFVSGFSGYMFPDKDAIANISDLDLNILSGRNDKVLVLQRLYDGNTREAVIQQLPHFKDIGMSFQQNSWDGFTKPKQGRYFGNKYLFIGFLNRETYLRERRKTLGFAINDQTLTYIDCDSNANSHIIFYVNENNTPFCEYHLDRSKTIAQSFTPSRLGSIMDDPSFRFTMEAHFGGCGLRYSSSGCQDVKGYAVGLPFTADLAQRSNFDDSYRVECQIQIDQRVSVNSRSQYSCHKNKACWDSTAEIQCYRAKGTKYPRTCQEAYSSGNTASGIHQLQTLEGKVFTVYCHFLNSSSGYVFPDRNAVATIGDLNLNDLTSKDDHVLVLQRHSDGSTSEAVLRQLPDYRTSDHTFYRDIGLTFFHDVWGGPTIPLNQDRFGNNYIFVGFYNDKSFGFSSNDENLIYNNCGNFNNYIAFFANLNNATFCEKHLDMSTSLLNSFKPSTLSTIMDDAHFWFSVELYFGSCGSYTSAGCSDTKGYALGLPFIIQ